MLLTDKEKSNNIVTFDVNLTFDLLDREKENTVVDTG